MGAQTHCNFLVLVVFTSDFRKKKPRNMADKYRTAETTNASNYGLSLENTRAEVDNVVGTMRRNIDSVMERGTNLDDLNWSILDEKLSFRFLIKQDFHRVLDMS